MANVASMETVVAHSMARTTFAMILLGIAGSMALVLSAVGIYGVISYTVNQRRAEIGVRMALGARAAQVGRMVVGQSLRASAQRLVRSMIDRFRAIYTDDLRRRAQAQGLTTRQVVSLASLIEKETGKPEERPLVAAVYRNRLKIGMGLQADPTVVYALQKAGRYDGNIRRTDLAFDSPYNTYRYPGLPPGPIAAPGKASLEAALMPASVAYLYFVSRNDGSHVFSETLAEHNRNVREFQVLFFRR
jgi:hypothetical protein